MMRSALCSSQQSSELALSFSPGACEVMSRFGMIASWGHGEGDRVWPRTRSHFRPALLRHCFGACPAPGATPVFCFPGPLGLGLPQQICRKKRGRALRGDFLRVPPRKQTLGLGAGPSCMASPRCALSRSGQKWRNNMSIYNNTITLKGFLGANAVEHAQL